MFAIDLDGDGDVDVLGILEDESKALVPLSHFSAVRAVLSNLRTAGFDAVQANTLVRALYSHADRVNGEAYRAAAWELLRQRRVHLRSAADRLAVWHGVTNDR